MNRALFALTLTAVFLAGCTTLPPLEVRSRAQVNVSPDGRSLDRQNVLYFKPGETNVEVVWRLPAGPLRFDRQSGIRIEGEVIDKVVSRGEQGKATAVALDPDQKEVVDCRVIDDKAFRCLNRNSRPGVYKYTIRVLDGDKATVLDPSLVNGSW